jgi:hypothetical protein
MKKSLLLKCLDIAYKYNTPELHPEWTCYKHYSFVIQNDKIVDWGTNRRGNAITFFGYPKYSKIHSETDAYFKSKGIMNRDSPFEVINIRLSKNGSIKNSKPCKCCTAFLKKLGCRSIWFTTEIGFCKW